MNSNQTAVNRKHQQKETNDFADHWAFYEKVHYQHCSGYLMDILGGLSIRYPVELPAYIRYPFDSNGSAFGTGHNHQRTKIYQTFYDVVTPVAIFAIMTPP